MSLSFAQSAQQNSSEQTVSTFAIAYSDSEVTHKEDESIWTQDEKYSYYPEYYDSNVSVVDEDKNILVNNKQINITQETNSQFIPFLMNRYYDGVDLSSKLIVIKFKNKQGNIDAAAPVNVHYSNDKIKFSWLVDSRVTAIEGEIQFEIQASGVNSKGEDYIWRTKPNGKLNILKALSGNGVIEPDTTWINSFLTNLGEQVTEAQAVLEESKSILNDIDTSAKEAEKFAKEAKEAADNVEQDLTNLENKFNESITEALKQYYTKEEIEELINSKDLSEELNELKNEINNLDGLANFNVEYDGSKMKFYNGETVMKEISINSDPSQEWTDSYSTEVDGKIENAKNEVIEKLNEFEGSVNEDLSNIYKEIDNLPETLNDQYYKKEEAENLFSSKKELSDLSENVSAVRSSSETNSSNISKINTKMIEMEESITDINDAPKISYEATYDEESIYTLWEIEGEGDSEVKTVKGQFKIHGGSGGGTSSVLKIEYVTKTPLIITSNDKALITYNFSGVDSSGDAVMEGTATWKIGSTIISTGLILSGENTFDATDYIGIGSQKLTLAITDDAGSLVTKTWTVQKIDIRLESNFNDKITYPIGNISFNYTPYGAIAKTIHFILDGEELESVETNSSGIQMPYSLPVKEHGSHLLESYITTEINGNTVESNHIVKDIIWYDEESDIPVIACVSKSFTAKQYDTTSIVYTVYDPKTSTPNVILKVDGDIVSELELNKNTQTWQYKSSDVGTHILTITCGETVKTLTAIIEELNIDVDPVTAGLELDFNPVGKSNNSVDKLWSNGTYSMSVSDNFDWANGGYQIDDNGDTYFLVKAGTRATFDYFMFNGGLNANPSVLGAEMKIVFMTEKVQDANAVWFRNVETITNEIDGVSKTTNVGIQMGVHSGWLKTNNASDTDVEDSDDNIAATNTYLYMPYSEEDIIEMDINIDTLNREDLTAKAFVMAYEDGVPSKAYVYDNGDRFYQYNPQPIVIGSDYCDVRIYRLKIYSNSLSTENIMRNFIADSRDSTTMLNRYNRNSIYYNEETGEYTPYSGEGILNPEKLAPVIPNVKVLMLETDHFTTSKKVFVKSKLRCIHSSGGKVYEGDPYYDNWLFENGYHSGQGTTSDNYGNAGRNIDFLFNCDGIHKPSDKVSAEESYVSQVTLGYKTENATTEKVTDWKGNEGKVSLTRTSVPNNFFNLKVNIASSENVNNALLQKRYNDFLPYISPAKKRDPRAKNDMEFVPAVIFLRETNPDISTHNEFLDTEWHFYALGNIGDSKKTDYTRAYDPDDMNEFTIEISDNTKNNATFQTGVFIDSNGNRKIEEFTITGTEEDGETIYTPVSTDKPQSFVYPVTLEEWENEKNMRYWCIYNEGFDGDHSFEPRYACCGDYRDGKLVNDTSGKGKAQVKLNNDVWRAFYRWVITSTDEEFVNELDEWCVRSAVEFFYAFTHIYTMMDNRAKNTFWHFAKTGTYREVSKPVKELLHVYCELINDEYVTTTDTEIHSDKTYYTQYAFDLWNYDNDKLCRCKTFSNIRRNHRRRATPRKIINLIISS